jgi:hypothetical protein
MPPSFLLGSHPMLAEHLFVMILFILAIDALVIRNKWSAFHVYFTQAVGLPFPWS